jgi:hypothetical protein
VDELRQSIDEAADGLHAFEEATRNATRNLQNVPDLLTLKEFEFQTRERAGDAGIPRAGDGAALPLPEGVTAVRGGKVLDERIPSIEAPLLGGFRELSGGGVPCRTCSTRSVVMRLDPEAPLASTRPRRRRSTTTATSWCRCRDRPTRRRLSERQRMPGCAAASTAGSPTAGSPPGASEPLPQRTSIAPQSAARGPPAAPANSPLLTPSVPHRISGPTRHRQERVRRKPGPLAR